MINEYCKTAIANCKLHDFTYSHAPGTSARSHAPAWERNSPTLRRRKNCEFDYVVEPAPGTPERPEIAFPRRNVGTRMTTLSVDRRGIRGSICNLQSLCLWLAIAISLSAGAPASADVYSDVQPKIVKIYGAGGFRGMAAYQSGMLISADGHILTVFSHVLDTDYITVVLADGRKFEAKLLGADPRMEIAVLKIAAADLPHFDLSKAVLGRAAENVLAFSNLFNVAIGDEPASVQHGVISVLTKLEARQGVYETPYRGPVYVLDVKTNNPGAGGGALVTRRGELLGMLGKELKNAMNSTYLNYAIPTSAMQESIESIKAGKMVARRDEDPRTKPRRSLTLDALGVVLVPDVLERTPPYVEQVRDGSPAEKAGVRPDDLIVLLGDQLVQSCKFLRGDLEYIDYQDPVRLMLLRGQELIDVTLQSEEKR
jgi:S1-C subfamily serine protease